MSPRAGKTVLGFSSLWCSHMEQKFSHDVAHLITTIPELNLSDGNERLITIAEGEQVKKLFKDNFVANNIPIS